MYPFSLKYHHTHIGLRITYYLSNNYIIWYRRTWQKSSCAGEILIGVNKFESSPRVTTIMSALFARAKLQETTLLRGEGKSPFLRNVDSN